MTLSVKNIFLSTADSLTVLKLLKIKVLSFFLRLLKGQFFFPQMLIRSNQSGWKKENLSSTYLCLGIGGSPSRWDLPPTKVNELKHSSE